MDIKSWMYFKGGYNKAEVEWKTWSHEIAFYFQIWIFWRMEGWIASGKRCILILRYSQSCGLSRNYWRPFLSFACFSDRFAVLANNNLQILNINKSDEGIYRCEGRVEARGEIDFRDIIVIVNGKPEITGVQSIVYFRKVY